MKDLTDAAIYLINLDSRKDRKEQFESQQALLTMPPIQRIPAISGPSLNIKNDERIGISTRVNILTEYRRSHYEIHSQGAVGASLSHLKTWQKFLKSSAKYALIMEDDAQLPATFSMMVHNCAKDLPEEWDIWILGSTNKPVDTETNTESHFQRILHFIGAHCYIISRRAARILIKDALPIESHVEHYMNNVAFLNNLIIVRNIRLHINQADRILNASDIRKPEGCVTCNVDDKETAMHARRINLGR
jgi:GR25 family glycosyltransferase involved in LPS biosynthesis